MLRHEVPVTHSHTRTAAQPSTQHTRGETGQGRGQKTETRERAGSC